MAARGHHRGHAIEYDESHQRWIYSDTGEPTVGCERPCGSCTLERTDEGHDGCLGTLSGVTNACCGHGANNEAYVVFADGRELRGEDAMAHFGMVAMAGELERINPKMDFSQALARAKRGERIARDGWNGANMYVFVQSHRVGDGGAIFSPYLMMRTVDGSFVPWLASQTDLLGIDWVVVE